MSRWLLLLIPFCIAAAPATAPTSAPATAPSLEMLDQGRVRLPPPAGWTLIERKADGRTLRYEIGGGAGTATIIVTPQDAMPTDETIATIAKTAMKEWRESVRNEGAQLLIPPQKVTDERFDLKLRIRTRGPDGLASDQLQMYRAMQLELVHVAVIANVDTEAEAERLYGPIEEMLDKTKLGPGPKPSAFRKTRVRLTVPPDWVEQRTDDPNGVVATYTNPSVPGARLVVRSRIIPKNARRDPQVQENAIDQLVDDFRHGKLPEGAGERYDERKIDHPRFKRYLVQSTDWNGGQWGTEFWCVIAGDVAIGVDALVPPLDQTVTRAAATMAASIRSLDDKRPVLDLELSPAVEPAQRQMRPRPTTTAPAGSPASAPSAPSPTRTPGTTTRPRP